MPSVVTIGVMPTRLTSTPLSVPATSAASTASRIASGSLPLSPLGTDAMRTTVSEIIPGTDRSMPPCWMTRVWPTATIARMAAKGSMPSSELWLRLCGWTISLTMNSRTVAATMPAAAPKERPPPGSRSRSLRESLAAGADGGVPADVVCAAGPTVVREESGVIVVYLLLLQLAQRAHPAPRGGRTRTN